METNTQEYIQGIVESLLFTSERPVTLEQLKEAINTIGIGIVDVRRCIEHLKQEYEEKNRGMTIAEIAGGYQMLSSPQYSSYIRAFLKTNVKEKLSKPSLETLAIVAYKQPISRAEIEFIRGVNSDGVVTHLLEKELIKIVGRKEIPGRPYIYGTAKQFLEYFGLKCLEDLPKLETLLSLIPPMPTATGENSLDVPLANTLSADSPAVASNPPEEASLKIESASELGSQDVQAGANVHVVEDAGNFSEDRAAQDTDQFTPRLKEMMEREDASENSELESFLRRALLEETIVENSVGIALEAETESIANLESELLRPETRIEAVPIEDQMVEMESEKKSLKNTSENEG